MAKEIVVEITDNLDDNVVIFECVLDLTYYMSVQNGFGQEDGPPYLTYFSRCDDKSYPLNGGRLSDLIQRVPVTSWNVAEPYRVSWAYATALSTLIMKRVAEHGSFDEGLLAWATMGSGSCKCGPHYTNQLTTLLCNQLDKQFEHLRSPHLYVDEVLDGAQWSKASAAAKESAKRRAMRLASL